MNRTLALIATGVMMLMVACKPGTPSQYIQPDEIEDILVDYHVAKSLAQRTGTSQTEADYNQALYLEAVLAKHGVSKELFDSSLVYYYRRADRFDAIYKRVAARLEEQALGMGASEGEIGKYASLNANGDTANIWSDRTMAVLMPQPPYNRWEFSIEADTTYHRGDALMLQFMSDYMMQGGLKGGMVYMAVEYNDTVIGNSRSFTASGLTQLHFPANEKRTVKSIKGYFYMADGGEQTANVRLLFLNNVQLIRFHTIHEESTPDEGDTPEKENALPTDSLARDSVGGRDDSTDIGHRVDPGSRNLRLSPDTGAVPHRMAPRPRPAETR